MEVINEPIVDVHHLRHVSRLKESSEVQGLLSLDEARQVNHSAKVHAAVNQNAICEFVKK